MNSSAFQKRLTKRHRADRRFRLYGICAIMISILFLGSLLVNIFSKGYTAFWQTSILLPIHFEAAVLDSNNPDYNLLIRSALKAEFPEVTGRRELFQLYSLMSKGAAYQL